MKELTPRAVERLLDAAEPLRERPELGGVDLDRYRLEGELGRGGMGVVYSAFDRELGRRVALKVLSNPAGHADAARQRFLREAKAAARLVHPHIAAVYDATTESIAMQCVEGTTLGEYAAAARAREPAASTRARELVALVRDAALAIHYAHGEGIVHRDLKPANLMVAGTERPHVYVMDFGLAKELAVDSSISLTECVVGTPGYMAPEQASGRSSEIGPATDVYGLGATLFACTAGVPPFGDEPVPTTGSVAAGSVDGQGVYALLLRIVDEPAPSLLERDPSVDADLATIVGKCLEKDPARRYASALALASDLDRWLRGEPIQARPPSVLYRMRRFVARRQGAVAASVAAAILAGLVALPFLVSARARRVAAEERRNMAEQVLELSQTVYAALRDARAARVAGLGHEESAPQILRSAIAECQAFLATTDVPRGWFFLGRLQRALGLYADAVLSFDRAADGMDVSPELLRERGLGLAALYRRSVPVNDEQGPAQLNSWRERGADDLHASLGDEPDLPSIDWIYAAGLLAWLQGDLGGAVALLREVIEMDPTHQEAHFSLSRIYLLSGRDDLGWRHSVIATDLLRGFRRAYLVREEIVPDRELLSLEGMRELMVDYNLLIQADPGDAQAYGLRAQVQARRAMRALSRGEREVAVEHLESALREMDVSVTVRPDSAPARVNRGALHAQLARVLAATDPERAAQSADAARADYDVAVSADPTLAVGWYDRALLRHHLSRLAQLARQGERARSEQDRARSDVGQALARVEPSHPWHGRMQELASELE